MHGLVRLSWNLNRHVPEVRQQRIWRHVHVGVGPRGLSLHSLKESGVCRNSDECKFGGSPLSGAVRGKSFDGIEPNRAPFEFVKTTGIVSFMLDIQIC